jgi:hypothetical protein
MSLHNKHMIAICAFGFRANGALRSNLLADFDKISRRYDMSTVRPPVPRWTEAPARADRFADCLCRSTGGSRKSAEGGGPVNGTNFGTSRGKWANHKVWRNVGSGPRTWHSMAGPSAFAIADGKGRASVFATCTPPSPDRKEGTPFCRGVRARQCPERGCRDRAGDPGMAATCLGLGPAWARDLFDRIVGREQGLDEGRERCRRSPGHPRARAGRPTRPWSDAGSRGSRHDAEPLPGRRRNPPDAPMCIRRRASRQTDHRQAHRYAAR